VKNVLGDSVDIITPWEPPVPWSALSAAWQGGTVTGPVGPLHIAPTAIPPDPGGYWKHTYTWTVSYAPSYRTDPGPPFDLYNNPAAQPGHLVDVPNQAIWPNVYDVNGNQVGSGAVPQAHRDIIGNTKETVNWGPLLYSTYLDFVANFTNSSEYRGDQNKQLKLVAQIQTGDTQDVTDIENELKLYRNTDAGSLYQGGGLDNGTNGFGSTPTKKAMQFAGDILLATATGTSTTPLTDPKLLGGPFTMERDPMFDCKRTYGSILVTDGLSNFGNGGGCNVPAGYEPYGNWAEPCWACASCGPTGVNGGAGCPDGGPSGFTCPNNATQFVAGQAKVAFERGFNGVDGQPRVLRARTWVIGISKEVGPCELNFTAYWGRTDANSKNKDGGLDFTTDQYLPDWTSNPVPDAIPGNYDGLTSAGCSGTPSHTPTHGDYAFFATTSAALENALIAIASNFGIGDYSTSGPSIAGSTTLGGNVSVGFISTASYPGWKGHMYAYDLRGPLVCKSDIDCPTTSNGPNRCNVLTGECKAPDTYPLLWDAGDVLSSFKMDGNPKTANNGLARAIYTWDPRTIGADTDSLVKIEDANVGAINQICNNCGWDNKVVDFVMGNDGNGNPRPWKLGAILNSTAAVIGAPEEWKQFSNHRDFETTYVSRHPVTWVGSSDGMLHCVDTKDGVELFALIPPDKLDLEKKLYDTYVENPASYVVGQGKLPGAHAFGVANSPRFGDVFDGTAYRTLLFITEGPGGSGIHALDVTHPFPGRTYAGGSADANYGYGGGATGPPVRPLWSKTGDGKANTTAMANLAYTWSIPALAGTGNGTNFELVMGNGYVNYDSTLGVCPDLANPTCDPFPRYLRLNPLDGTVRGNDQLTHLTSEQPLHGPWVRNQAFADSTIWSTSAKFFQPDNDVNQGVQLDLQGRVWLLPRHDMASNNWDVPVILSDPSGMIAGSPLYYSAAVASYPTDSPLYNVYTFSSGSFYEISDYIKGDDVGYAPNFIPALYIVSRPISGAPQTIYRKNIDTINYGVNNAFQFGHKTQVTAYPTIFTPKLGATGVSALALFLVYDPEAIDLESGTCAGKAFLVKLEFNPGTLATVDPVIKVDEAGTGAASGFALAGQLPVVAKSFVGAGGRAYFYKVKNLLIPGAGGLGGQIAWWMELQ